MCEGMFTLATGEIRADVTRYDDEHAYWWANLIPLCKLVGPVVCASKRL